MSATIDLLPGHYEEQIKPVIASYRITLPEEWREQFNVKVGDSVKCIWSKASQALIIVPVDVQVIVKERQPTD